MTEKEKIMYKIMSSIYYEDIPLVFKGALITKLILLENININVYRETQDIDANWVDEKPSMEYLNTCIDMAVKKVNNTYSSIIIRDYSDKQSAGLKIINENKNEILKIDIKISPIKDTHIYYLGDLTFKGVKVNQILCDKISSISSDKIFRRIKDIVDIYALSQCIDTNINEILKIAKETNRNILNFEAFINRKSDVEYAYNKLRGIENKPEFEELYLQVCKFLNPFISKNYELIWNSKENIWENNKQKYDDPQKSSLLNRIDNKKKTLNKVSNNFKNIKSKNVEK